MYAASGGGEKGIASKRARVFAQIVAQRDLGPDRRRSASDAS
jgi:hypothetical protein